MSSILFIDQDEKVMNWIQCLSMFLVQDILIRFGNTWCHHWKFTILPECAHDWVPSFWTPVSFHVTEIRVLISLRHWRLLAKENQDGYGSGTISEQYCTRVTY